jgi:hypothetical protein
MLFLLWTFTHVKVLVRVGSMVGDDEHSHSKAMYMKENILVVLRTCKSSDICKYSILLMSGTLNLLWNA